LQRQLLILLQLSCRPLLLHKFRRQLLLLLLLLLRVCSEVV
jgi:hypothetical protein